MAIAWGARLSLPSASNGNTPGAGGGPCRWATHTVFSLAGLSIPHPSPHEPLCQMGKLRP